MSRSQLIWTAGLVLAFLLLVGLLQPILMPFVSAAFLAYMGDPLADRLEERGLSRTAAVLVVFAFISLLLGAFLLFVIPLVIGQLNLFVTSLPDILAWLEGVALPYVLAQLGLQSLDLPDLDIRKTLLQHWRQAGSLAAPFLKQISSSGLAMVTWVVNLLLIPVVTFYLLRDWDHMVAWLRESLPRNVEGKTVEVVAECDAVISEFFRGQLLIMASLSLVYCVGLWLAGIEGALVLGLVAGLSSVVPYLGVAVGLLSAGLAAIIQYHDWLPVIWVALVFGVGQLLESMVLTPLLVGDRIGLHPVAVIFAILAGGQLAGFVGVLIALPVAAVLVVILRHVHDHYKQSHLYTAARIDE